MTRTYRFGEFQLDLDEAVLRKAGEIVPLPKLSFRTLEVLITAAPRVVTFDDLVTQVWGSDRVITQENLSQRIRILRNSLGDTAKSPTFIEVVRGRGFRFVPTVESTAAATPKRLDQRELLQFYRYCSIAVLPFVDTSPGLSMDWVASGMTSEIINALAQNERIKVPAVSTTNKFDVSAYSPREVGEKLDVNYVLEGTVRVVGDRLKVSARLIRASDESYVWSDTFEGQSDAIDSLEAGIAAKVDNVIRVKMFVDALEQHSDHWNEAFAGINPEAVALYVRGLQARFTGTLRSPVGARSALQLIQRAVELDDSFEAAHRALISFTRQRQYSGAMPVAMAQEIIDGSLQKMAQLGQPVEPYLRALIALTIHVDYAEAEAQFELTLEQLPERSAWCYWFLASIAAARGEPVKASRLLERASRYPPFVAAEQGELDTGIGMMHTVCGNFDMADRHFEKSLAIQSTTGSRAGPLVFKAYNLVARGDLPGLQPVFSELWEAYGHVRPELYAFMVALLGDKPRASAILEQAETHPGNVLPIALGWMTVDEPQRALEAIRFALGEQTPLMMSSLRLAAYWDPLRDETGFKELLECLPK